MLSRFFGTLLVSGLFDPPTYVPSHSLNVTLSNQLNNQQV